VSRPVRTVVAAPGAPWESALLAGAAGAPGDVVVVRRCVDVADLMAVAAQRLASVAVVEAGLRRLDAEVVATLAADGVRVLVVTGRDGADPSAWGVDGVVRQEDGALALVEAVVALGAQPSPAGTVAEAPDGRAGQVVAVWGPAGAPGRSTVAVALADEAARLGRRVLLVDADTYGGTLAALLGAPAGRAGVFAAARAVAAAGLGDDELLTLAPTVRPGLRLLAGGPAHRWPELSPRAVRAIARASRAIADLTVVDCGFGLEQDEELSYDTRAPLRNGATLAALAVADRVLAVGHGDVPGLVRLIDAWPALVESTAGAPVGAVLTRTDGPQAAALLRRHADVDAVVTVPADHDTLAQSRERGATLAEVAPHAAARVALAVLAAQVVGAPPRRRQGLRPGLGRLRRRAYAGLGA